MLPPEAAIHAESLRPALMAPRTSPVAGATARGGADLLDVYRAGEIAVLHDADGEFFAKLLEKGLDINWAMDSMYTAFSENFGSEHEYVQFYILQDFGVFFAFYQPIANDVTGIGYDGLVPGETFDMSTDSKLEGLIFMNYYGMWTDEPEQGRYVFNQEFMHRWGSFVNVSHPDLDPEALLGRDTAHWSYWFDTTNSPMEGNDWVDNGDGTWTIDQASGSTYSDLDLYLMGLIPAEEVGEQTFLVVSDEEQSRVGRDPAYTPEYFGDTFDGSSMDPITVAATPVTFTVDDIIAAEGARTPGFEDAPKTFHMATVVLVLSGDTLDDSVLASVDGLRTTFEGDWEEDVGYRADLDTTLGDASVPTWGEPVDTGSTDTADTAITDDEDEDTATEKEEPAGCGCAVSSTEGWWIAGLAAMAWRRRRR